MSATDAMLKRIADELHSINRTLTKMSKSVENLIEHSKPLPLDEVASGDVKESTNGEVTEE